MMQTVELRKPVHAGKLIQIRCDRCRAMLAKYRIGQDAYEYKNPDAKIEIDKATQGISCVCHKCGTVSIISKKELLSL